MLTRAFRYAAGLTGLLSLFVSLALGDTIYATDGTSLFTIDPATANVLSTITLSGDSGINGLTFGPGGTLYGIGATVDTIDPLSGTVSTAISGYSTCCGGTNGLAFSGGYLYNLAGGRYFAQVDPVSGNATNLASSNSFFDNNELTGLTYSAVTPGNLVGIGNGTNGYTLYDFDPTVGPTDGDAIGALGTLPGDPIALAAGANVIYGVAEIIGSGSGSGSGSGPRTFSDVLFSLNAADPSVINLIGDLPANTQAIAVSPDSFSPEPASFSLLAVGAGGLFLLRKRIFKMR